MEDIVSSSLPSTSQTDSRIASLLSAARASAPTLPALFAALASAVLAIISFPDFNLWPLAWFSLIPLLIVIARRPVPFTSFLLGWLSGSLFFYVSCHWLTFSMIHYGGIPGWAASLLLIPGALVVGIFPGAFALVLALAIRRFGSTALLVAPFIWIAFEWARLGVTGQLWNALGYSQAYETTLIQSARWGGVYAVSLLIVALNSAIALTLVRRNMRALLLSIGVIAVVVITILLSNRFASANEGKTLAAHVIALQPNVPMDLIKSAEEMRQLTARHISMSEEALAQLPNDELPRVLVWPESPMNFTYANDLQFQDLVSRFARNHTTALLFNSQEPAPNNGIYNSAVLVNQQGRLVGQYDKIRLLPFGEYVPLPRWLPGANLITAIVGNFSPGSSYKLFPVGNAKAGVFICIESAYPSIARTFADEGAELLINISNDGYLGRTAVMRQHLANAVFRAVENGRPLLRVTNTGISAYITPRGEVRDQTVGFEPAVRSWTVMRSEDGKTFYTKHGDWLALLSALLTAVIVASAIVSRRSKAVS